MVELDSTRVTVALVPAATAPRLHVTVPAPWLQPAPWLGVAETRPRPAGMVSVTTTPVASLGPMSWAVNVKVAFVPVATASCPLSAIETSAEAVTFGVTMLALLLAAF